MKKLIIASILAIGFVGSAVAADFAGVSGAASVLSGSAAVATSSGNGGAFSGASNSSYASTGIGSSSNSGSYGTWCPPSSTTYGNASISGDVATGSKSSAGNISYGNATGGAAAGGSASADASGAGGYVKPGVFGGVAGTASSDTKNAVVAGRNQGGFIQSKNEAGFEASADSSKKTTWTWGGTKVALDPNTDASAYSKSAINPWSGGNAYIYNSNGGSAASGAVAGAGSHISTDNDPD